MAEKRPSLDDVYKSLRKAYGSKVSTGRDLPPVLRRPTGSLVFDIATGGWAEDRITIFGGKKSTAKTATAYHAVAMSQKLYPDRGALWVSMEPFDRDWALINGVDLDKLIVVEPETGEDAINIMDAFLDTRDLSIAVFDSLGAIISEYELEKEAENGMQNTRAKLQKRLFLKTNARLHVDKDGKRGHTVVLMLTHIYNTMNQYHPEVLAGGEAMNSNASVILAFRHKDFIWPGNKEKEGTPIGIKVGVKFEKDKTRGQGEAFEFEFFNRNGWNGAAKAGTYNDYPALIQFGQLVPTPADPFIKKGGAWFTVGERKYQGEDNLENALRTDPEFCREVETAIRKHFNVDFPGLQ